MTIRIFCPEGHPVVVADSKLGSEVACPHCLAIFFATLHSGAGRQARAEKGKARPSRDDDDDDEDKKPRKKAKPVRAKPTDDEEEVEKPRKKSKAKKNFDDEEDEEDEKPRKKKAAKDDDEDEDEDVGEGVEEEPEAPIEWTPRKRQLNVCSHGLNVMVIAFYMLCAFTVFTALAIDYYEMFDNPKRDDWKNGPAWYLFYYLAVPLLYLVTAALIGGMVVSFFAVPAKAEARGALLSTIVFGGLVFLLGLLLILTMTDVIVTDELRKANMTSLLVGFSLLCFAVCLLSAMGYQSKLFLFMKMHLESSQPITNAAFVLLIYIALLIVVTIVSYPLKDNIGNWIGFPIAFAVDGIAGYGIYMLVVQAKLIQLLRKRIASYIRDE